MTGLTRFTDRWGRLVAWCGAAVTSVGIAACGVPRPAAPDDHTAVRTVTVVSVHDGDTVRVREAGGRERTVRLATIDAPELAQPFGPLARDAVRERVQGREVTLESRGRDRYGRVLAVLWIPGEMQAQDLALWAVRQGLAWHYTAYAHEQPLNERWRYALAEAQARFHGVGLWAQSDPQPPWAWRRERRAIQRSPPSGADPSVTAPVRD